MWIPSSTFLFCASTSRDARHLDRLVEVELGDCDLDAAALDLRDVEDVVDDPDHVLARAGDLLGEFALLVVELRAEQQLVHPDHAVHRRTNLVADVGEERRLEVRRLDRLVACDAVGLVELEQALETLTALAREQPDQSEQGKRRERGDRGGVDLLGDDQRDAGERRIDDVHPCLAALLGERCATLDPRAQPGDEEVDGELRKERSDEQERRRGRRGDTRGREDGDGPIDHQAFPSVWIRRDGRTFPLSTSGARTTTSASTTAIGTTAIGIAKSIGTNASCVGTVKPNGVSMRTRTASASTRNDTSAGSASKECTGAKCQTIRRRRQNRRETDPRPSVPAPTSWNAAVAGCRR